MKLEKEDVKTIFQLAHKDMESASIQRGEEKYFVADCYMKAFFTFLNMNGYEIIKRIETPNE